MLFDQTANISAMIANKMLYFTNGDVQAARNSKILIYSGAQPTIASFLSNWSTLYYLVLEDDYSTQTPATFGTNLLAGYGPWTTNSATFNPSTYSVQLNSSGNAITLDSSSIVPPKHFYQSGTATWAVIFLDERTGGMAANGGVGAMTQSSTGTWNTFPFIIAPVSDLNGSGTVRLASTAISSSVPDLGDVFLSFNVG